MNEQPFCWPDGKRIAITIMVLLETWSEGKGPPYSVQTTSLKPGTIDNSSIAWGQYGGNEGIWRILRILDHFKAPGTFCPNAQKRGALSRRRIQQAARSGHEIAGHGYLQDQAHDLSGARRGACDHSTVLGYPGEADAGSGRRDGRARCSPGAKTPTSCWRRRACFGTAKPRTSAFPERITYSERSDHRPSRQRLRRQPRRCAPARAISSTSIGTPSTISICANRCRCCRSRYTHIGAAGH